MNENIKARYEVHKLEGKAIRRIATPKVQMNDKGKPVLDKDGNSKLLGGFDYKDKEVDAGYMVYFPNGSSIRIWTKEGLVEQGFDIPSDLVNMETGDTVGRATAGDEFKRKSEQIAATKETKVAHT